MVKEQVNDTILKFSCSLKKDAAKSTEVSMDRNENSHELKPAALPQLHSPLTKETILLMDWDLPSELTKRGFQVLEQRVKVHKVGLVIFQFDVKPDQQSICLRLPVGFAVAELSPTIQVKGFSTIETHLGQRNIESHFLEVRIKEARFDFSCADTLTAVYSEYQQELRRTRTVYETLLLAETVGFATLVSQAGPPLESLSLGSRAAFAGALLFLTSTLVALVTRLAKRYFRLTFWLKNLEFVFGLRSGIWDGRLIEEVGMARSDPTAKAHWMWASVLTVYTVLLGVTSIWFVFTKGLQRVTAGYPWALAAFSSLSIMVCALVYFSMFDRPFRGFWRRFWKDSFITLACVVMVFTAAFLHLRPPRANVEIVNGNVTPINMNNTRFGLLQINLRGGLRPANEHLYVVFPSTGRDMWQAEKCGLLELSGKSFVVFPLDRIGQARGSDGASMFVALFPTSVGPTYAKLEDLPKEIARSGEVRVRFQ